jgi:hypothetical protein
MGFGRGALLRLQSRPQPLLRLRSDRSTSGVRHVVAVAEAEAETIPLERGHAVHALASELRIRRTMTGKQIDHCIERALALPATEVRARMVERQRMLERQHDHFD